MGKTSKPNLTPKPKLTLEELKAKRWPAERKAERIAKAIAAWKAPGPSFHLTPAQWKQIAEDPDFLEE